MSTPTTVSRALAASGLVPFEAKLLLAHVLGRDRAWLAAHANETVAIEQAKAFDALARRRRNGEPVAYLLGRREFYGLDLEITPDVLIPRPETELLVELALARLPDDRAIRVLDLGTGSGGVALAIAAARRGAHVVGTDVSLPALALAARNAARLRIDNATFTESDWFEALARERFDLVAGNPPYVAAGDPHLGEGDLRYEPQHALTSGADGLRSLRTIVRRRRRISPPAAGSCSSMATTRPTLSARCFATRVLPTSARRAISPGYGASATGEFHRSLR